MEPGTWNSNGARIMAKTTTKKADAKADKAKGDALIELVFSDANFKKGFEKKK